jgi:hypothetical protein
MRGKSGMKGHSFGSSYVPCIDNPLAAENVAFVGTPCPKTVLGTAQFARKHILGGLKKEQLELDCYIVYACIGKVAFSTIRSQAAD